ncbi:MAG: PLP-dependent transferase [Oscillospiraceae bacterium]|nr:PLP-dependent transferase [Oscillospiraceae bacterium]
MNTPIHSFLSEYASSEFERCHMPGHAGLHNPFDITEIEGAVDIISESERNAAELFGAKRTLFSCSGSTLAIFAMLTPFANKRIIAMRYSHRSLIDVAILLNIEIDWVYPDEEISDRIFPETAGVFVTSIDYYGRTCDIPKIAEMCKKYNVPLLVDNAHGAYLVFTDNHPIKLGAAMTADSAHKTLPALTSAAYLHIADESYIEQAKSGLALFSTSSPSYLILNSLDLCNAHILNEKKRALTAFEAVRQLKSRLSGDFSVADSDMLRVTVDVNAYGYSGYDFSTELRKRGVICEMSDSQYVILLFSTITEYKNTERVLMAMNDIPRRTPIIPSPQVVVKPRVVMSPRQAYFSPTDTVTINGETLQICREVNVSIPPCVPTIVPGETTNNVQCTIDN